MVQLILNTNGSDFSLPESQKGGYSTVLTPLSVDVERFAYAVRKHRAVENRLHRCLDVIFDEDASRARKDMSPLNLNVLRKTALSLCKNADFGRRLSIPKKRFAAALNPQRLLDILFASFQMLLPWSSRRNSALLFLSCVLY